MLLCAEQRLSSGDSKRSVGLLTEHRRCRALVLFPLLLVSLLLALHGAAAAKASKEKSTFYLFSTVGGNGGVYTVTGCSECTVNISQRWCPSTMRCYPAGNCTCDGPVSCIDLRTCFYGSRPSCRECVDSGGVFCVGGTSVLTPRARGRDAGDVRCYPPEDLSSRTAHGVDGPSALAVSTVNIGVALPVCDASTCRDGQCVRLAAQCPEEVSDPLLRSYEVISVIVVLVLTGLVIRNVYRLVF
jgi:hypothetical protein